jgi:hypothetical protein
MAEKCAICGETFETGDRITYVRFGTLRQQGIDGEPVMRDYHDLPRNPAHWHHVGENPIDR